MRVSTTAERYDIEIGRDGAEYVPMRKWTGLRGVHHETPRDCSVRGCGWPVALEFTIPPDWPSGGYLVTLRGVEKMAAAFIAEEMTLRELRKARHLTQVSVARELGVSQDAVSRLEQRSDLLLSTLRRTVEAMGGSLSLIARFPDRPPVELSGIAEHKARD